MPCPNVDESRVQISSSLKQKFMPSTSCYNTRSLRHRADLFGPERAVQNSPPRGLRRGVDKLRTGPHHKERESVTSVAAKCCSIYPGQTGARGERAKGDVAFVAIHFKHFAAFFAHAWPAL